MRIPLRMILVISLIVTACNRGNPSTVRAESEPTQTSPTIEDMQRERDDYVKSIEGKLDDLDKKIDALSARAPNAIKGLKDQVATVATKLDDLRNANINSWRTRKGAVEAALVDLESSYRNVASAYQQIPATPPAIPKSSTIPKGN